MYKQKKSGILLCVRVNVLVYEPVCPGGYRCCGVRSTDAPPEGGTMKYSSLFPSPPSPSLFPAVTLCPILLSPAVMV